MKRLPLLVGFAHIFHLYSVKSYLKRKTIKKSRWQDFLLKIMNSKRRRLQCCSRPEKIS